MGTLPSPHHKAPLSPVPGIPDRRLQSSAGKPESWEWTKLRKIALRQMERFIDLFPLVLRNEDLTAVNRMRITCRRLEQILERVYAKPRPRHIKKLRRRLKLCRCTLGKLRDCDALLAVAERSMAAKQLNNDAWQVLQEA